MHVHISYGYTAIAFNVDVSDIATIAIQMICTEVQN